MEEWRTRREKNDLERKKQKGKIEKEKVTSLSIRKDLGHPEAPVGRSEDSRR